MYIYYAIGQTETYYMCQKKEMYIVIYDVIIYLPYIYIFQFGISYSSIFDWIVIMVSIIPLWMMASHKMMFRQMVVEMRIIIRCTFDYIVLAADMRYASVGSHPITMLACHTGVN